jgi:hypothetical protein
VGDESAELVIEDRFAIIPEWLLDADISDAAVRLYAVLLRYGNSSGARMPSRSTLAGRLRKRSSVDRAMKELVGIGAVRVEHRYDGSQRLTNAYHVRTSRPGPTEPPSPNGAGSRKSAATPNSAARGGRTDAARVAAEIGDDREHLTDRTPSPSFPGRNGRVSRASRQEPAAADPGDDIAGDCGVDDWPAFVAQVQQVRRELGSPVTRWAGPCLTAALQLAVNGRGWPAERATEALLRVAADPETRSPMRVAEAGPWWDEPPPASNGPDLEAMAHALLEADGVRVQLQLQARRDLEARGLPVTRAAVIRGAYRLLTEPDPGSGAT